MVHEVPWGASAMGTSPPPIVALPTAMHVCAVGHVTPTWNVVPPPNGTSFSTLCSTDLLYGDAGRRSLWSSAATALPSAFPLVAFITWPVKNPASLSSPAA